MPGYLTLVKVYGKSGKTVVKAPGGRYAERGEVASRSLRQPKARIARSDSPNVI